MSSFLVIRYMSTCIELQVSKRWFLCLVTDIEKPAFTFCPGSFEEYADSALNYTTIQLPTINATDNSGQQPLITCSGIRDKYYIGEHLVRCFARDGSGNEGTCQFSIQVRCKYCIKLWFQSYHSIYNSSKTRCWKCSLHTFKNCLSAGANRFVEYFYIWIFRWNKENVTFLRLLETTATLLGLWIALDTELWFHFYYQSFWEKVIMTTECWNHVPNADPLWVFLKKSMTLRLPTKKTKISRSKRKFA